MCVCIGSRDAVYLLKVSGICARVLDLTVHGSRCKDCACVRMMEGYDCLCGCHQSMLVLRVGQPAGGIQKWL